MEKKSVYGRLFLTIQNEGCLTSDVAIRVRVMVSVRVRLRLELGLALGQG